MRPRAPRHGSAWEVHRRRRCRRGELMACPADEGCWIPHGTSGRRRCRWTASHRSLLLEDDRQAGTARRVPTSSMSMAAAAGPASRRTARRRGPGLASGGIAHPLAGRAFGRLRYGRRRRRWIGCDFSESDASAEFVGFGSASHGWRCRCGSRAVQLLVSKPGVDGARQPQAVHARTCRPGCLHLVTPAPRRHNRRCDWNERQRRLTSFDLAAVGRCGDAGLVFRSTAQEATGWNLDFLDPRRMGGTTAAFMSARSRSSPQDYRRYLAVLLTGTAIILRNQRAPLPRRAPRQLQSGCSWQARTTGCRAPRRGAERTGRYFARARPAFAGILRRLRTTADSASTSPPPRRG